MQIVYQSDQFTLKSYGGGRAYLLMRSDGADRFWFETAELEALMRSLHAQWMDGGVLTDTWAQQLLEGAQ